MLSYCFAAFFAFVCYDKTIANRFNRNRFHHATAIGCAIPRVVINMTRPQAMRTMVCITITKNHRATMGAFKIFNGFGKFFHLITGQVHYDTFASVHLFHPIRPDPFCVDVSFDECILDQIRRI